MKRSPRIHFTHHLCIETNPARWHDRTRGDNWASIAFDRYRELWPHDTWPSAGCNYTRGKSQHHFSTIVEHVTCERCLRELRHRASGVSHDELVKRTWRVCCYEVGAPSPLTDEDVAAIQRARRETQLRLVDDLHAQLVASIARGPAAAAFVAKIETISHQLDGDALEIARPALHAWAFVGELLEHVDEAIARAQALMPTQRSEYEHIRAMSRRLDASALEILDAA